MSPGCHALAAAQENAGGLAVRAWWRGASLCWLLPGVPLVLSRCCASCVQKEVL